MEITGRHKLSRDPVSGVVTVFPDLTGKPLPTHTRMMPPGAETCPLCTMTSSFVDEGGRGRVFDGQVWRDVLAVSPTWLSVQNRWPVFPPPDGVADMFLLRHHAEALEELPAATIEDLLLLLAATEAAPSPAAHMHTATFLSVGVQAGSSQRHLHAQRVGASQLETSEDARKQLESAWQEDEEHATRRGLLLPTSSESAGALSWVAPSPSASGELRITAATSSAAAGALRRTLQALIAIRPWAYTLAFHGAEPWRIRIIPILSAPTAIDRLLGVHVALAEPSHMRESVARALLATN